jgi:hypothetical protein
MGARTQEAVTIRSKQTSIDLIRLLGILAMGAKDDTGIVDPAPNRQTLARLMECEERTITNRIKKLIASGELEQLRVGSGPGNPSAFRIKLEISETTLLKGENEAAKGESEAAKGEKSEQNNTDLHEEMGEIRELIFTLCDQIDVLKGEISELKGERVKAKGGKGESQRVKGHSFKNADDPFDPSLIQEGEGEKPPTPPTAVRHPDCPKPETAAEQAISAHPALWVWLEAKMAWPGFEGAAYLVERMGDSPNPKALETAKSLWNLSNNKPGNAIGILDWYDELCKDPTWTPKKRFSNGSKADKPIPSAGMTEIAPGLY